MKDQVQSIGEILNETPQMRALREVEESRLQDASLADGRAARRAMEDIEANSIEPISELETQILKLKVARDEHTAMLQEIGITLAQLLEQKRKELQGRIGDLTQELDRLDAELGQSGQSAANQARRSGKRPSGGGWNTGQVRAGSQTDRILSVLRNNPAGEFTAKDLENLSGVFRGNINGCVNAAVKRGEVRHRKVGTDAARWSWIGPKQ